jgi:glycerol kinase
VNDARLFAALDVGGHAARALIYDIAGAVQARAERPLLTRCDGAKVEHDADATAGAAQDALDEACMQLGKQAARVAAAGLATQRASIVCAERDTGRALTPVISWQDRRAAAWLSAQALDAVFVRRETGLPVSPHYGASKLRWCLDHVDGVRAAHAAGTLAMGPLSSFLTLRLTRERPWLADPCNASRTLLWSLRERDWSAPLLDQFGIPRTVLPRCVPNRHGWGYVAAAGRAVPLAVVTGDQSAVPYAAGEPDPSTVYINIGTGAFLQRLAAGNAGASGRLLRSVVWQEDGATRFTEEGTVNGAGRALEEIADAAGEDRRATFHHLEDWLREIRDPPLFLNGIAGLGSPWWVPDFPTCFVGDGSFPARAVAVVDSICFLIQRNLDEWTTAAMAPRILVVSGGLARLEGLCRRMANLSGCEVKRPGAVDATARGLAYLAAGCPADWTSPPARCFAPQSDAALKARYERWLELMEQEAGAKS